MALRTVAGPIRPGEVLADPAVVPPSAVSGDDDRSALAGQSTHNSARRQGPRPGSGRWRRFLPPGQAGDDVAQGPRPGPEPDLGELGRGQHDRLECAVVLGRGRDAPPRRRLGGRARGAGAVVDGRLPGRGLALACGLLGAGGGLLGAGGGLLGGRRSGGGLLGCGLLGGGVLAAGFLAAGFLAAGFSAAGLPVPSPAGPRFSLRRWGRLEGSDPITSRRRSSLMAQ